MNELYVKIDLTQMAYFGNIESKIRGLVCQLTFIFMVDL